MLRLGDRNANPYHKMGESLKTRLAVNSEASAAVHSHGDMSTDRSDHVLLTQRRQQ